ncbi:MAG TPA: transcriptional regulator [Desulfobacteraceae bacterium]|nr:transcriptional regulator [Desulfobacteraceae bacterium]|tara:strand:- start:977 stop:1357 length:381 start_codon:yes stop_codon:yes gene_type:complete
MNDLLVILKSISDRNRLRILSALLVHEELCACQITEFLQVAGATASKHLSQMVTAGVLSKRKQGRWIYFRLNRDNPDLSPLFEWVNARISGTKQAKKDMCTLKQVLEIPCEELSQNQRESGRCSTS